MCVKCVCFVNVALVYEAFSVIVSYRFTSLSCYIAGNVKLIFM